MKNLTRVLGKKIILVGVTALFAGVGATAGVFAAIPDSATGIISGCRNNTNGALRAIDAQSGETCDGTETPISITSPAAIPAPTTALLRLIPDSNNAHNYVMDPSRSRNITKFDLIDDPNPDNAAQGSKTACLQIAFVPELSIGTVDDGTVGAGGNSGLKFNLLHEAPTNPQAIQYYCGSSDYNAYAVLSPYVDAAPQSIFFTK